MEKSITTIIIPKVVVVKSAISFFKRDSSNPKLFSLGCKMFWIAKLKPIPRIRITTKKATKSLLVKLDLGEIFSSILYFIKEIPKKKTKTAPKNPKNAINKAFIPLSENRAFTSAFKPMAVIATVHKTSSKGRKIGVKIFAT